MIHEIEIKNFQSLKDVKVQLQPFTVIVGRSSSGKSAFTRALRTLTSNRRGHAFITNGERLTTIKAHTDKGTVTLTRGKAAADNSYTLTTPTDDPSTTAAKQVFTKLGGETPEEVSRFLGISAKDPINYASQFDKPYLLDESQGEAARVLGALTNVHVIFEGARESNRRKLNHSQELKMKAGDLEAIKEKIPQIQAISQQDKALQDAEVTIAQAQRTQQKIISLRSTIETLTVATRHIEAVQQLATQPDIKDTEAIAALERLNSYKVALQTQGSTHNAQIAAQRVLDDADAALAAVEASYKAEVATLTGDIREWIEATAQTFTYEGSPALTLNEAARVVAKYLEERA